MLTSSPVRPVEVPASGEAMERAARTCALVGGRRIPIVLPMRNDARLKLSVVIIAVSMLGQTSLRFQVSLLQILVCVLSGALLETAVMFRNKHVVMWPASAIQTGVSVAFVFRVSGTHHGDLWSPRGLSYFVLVVVVSLASKYLLRRDGRPVFNPSNLGIALGLLVFGPRRVFSEHLWWAPLGLPLLISLMVIVVGAWWVLRQVEMIPMAVAFLAVFLPLIGAFALAGRGYYARWHTGPVTGGFYWVTLALSPEVLIFVFFMMSDPQTAPRSARGRIAYGAVIGLLAGALIVGQSTEWGIKVALLASLVVGSVLVPLIDRLCAPNRRRLSIGTNKPAGIAEPPTGLASASRNPVVIATIVIAVFAATGALRAAHDRDALAVERSTTPGHSQSQ